MSIVPLLALTLLSLLTASALASGPINALAPADVILGGQHELVGLVVGADGTVYASDRGGGVVHRVEPGGAVSILISGLDRPAGLALDADGRLLIAEEHRDRVLRRESSGALTVLATGLRRPRWLTVAPGGALYITAHRLDGVDGPDPDEGRMIVRRDPVTGVLSAVAAGIQHLEGLALHGGALYAAAKRLDSQPQVNGLVLRYPVLAGGGLGAPTQFVATSLKQPTGLAADRLGALYLSTKELVVGEDPSKRAIGKIPPDAHVTGFADQLGDPAGLALGPDGFLYAADGAAGRLLRFRAPPAPDLDGPPDFTNQSPFTLHGSTEAGARVDAFVGGALTPVTGTADAAGAFALILTLNPDSPNALEVLATAHGGLGLSSAPAEATLTHDGQPPAVSFTLPPSLAHVRQTVTVTAQASDPHDVASLVLRADNQTLSTTLTPSPPAGALSATAPWNTTVLPDGTQTLEATASDRAGNMATATRTVVVDNTPPDTSIVTGPEGTLADTTATFTVGGTDNLTPTGSLLFAWRLDAGSWSAFTMETTITLAGLAGGPHTFEVTARDLAGNEDPTPASRSFTVSTLSVQIIEPTSGATVPAGLVLVRGTVASHGTAVSVSVNDRPAAVHGATFTTLTPLTAGPTAISVTATSAGSSVTATVPITVVGVPPPVALVAVPSAGLAPLTVRFSIATALPAVLVELDANGDGVIDAQGAALEDAEFTFTQPGLYVATATTVDATGTRTVQRALITVHDRAVLDGLLQGRWADFKAALRAGRVEEALQQVAVADRDDYRAMLTGLGPQLSNIDAILPGITLVSVERGRAEYEMPRLDQGLVIAHLVVFVQDDDGVWRLEFF